MGPVAADDFHQVVRAPVERAPDELAPGKRRVEERAIGECAVNECGVDVHRAVEPRSPEAAFSEDCAGILGLGQVQVDEQDARVRLSGDVVAIPVRSGDSDVRLRCRDPVLSLSHGATATAASVWQCTSSSGPQALRI